MAERAADISRIDEIMDGAPMSDWMGEGNGEAKRGRALSFEVGYISTWMVATSFDRLAVGIVRDEGVDTIDVVHEEYVHGKRRERVSEEVRVFGMNAHRHRPPSESSAAQEYSEGLRSRHLTLEFTGSETELSGYDHRKEFAFDKDGDLAFGLFTPAYIRRNVRGDFTSLIHELRLLREQDDMLNRRIYNLTDNPGPLAGWHSPRHTKNT